MISVTLEQRGCWQGSWNLSFPSSEEWGDLVAAGWRGIGVSRTDERRKAGLRGIFGVARGLNVALT